MRHGGRAGGGHGTGPGHLGFVARFPRSLGALTQSTYLGGASDDLAHALTIHAVTGDVYVGGQTLSADLPGTAGGAQPTLNGEIANRFDAWIARLTFSLAETDPAPGPDLAVTKAHARFFRGATYTLAVTNIGTTATVGAVTVADTLPAGLTAVELTGAG